MAHLELAGLVKAFGEVKAVDGVDLAVAQGEAVALLGPSGCGKTTTLRMVAGLAPPDAGRISAAGRDITAMRPHKRNMGYVFQSYALFPHMDVAANVGFGLIERGIARPERDARVREALAMVRLQGLEARRPRELSGGQQQRVAVARSLVVRPDVLLLDESLSNLDARLRESMRHEIRDIQRSLGITTLFVTHDQVEALTMCDRIAVMDKGRIAQIGGPEEIYEKPATRFVATFVGRMNVLPAEAAGDGSLVVGGARILAASPLPSGRLDIMVRPQRMRWRAGAGKDENRLPGRVKRVVFVGERQEILVDTESGLAMAEQASGLAAPAEGEAVELCWSKADTLVFPRDGA